MGEGDSLFMGLIVTAKADSEGLFKPQQVR
jgi:hypothetical protein